MCNEPTLIRVGSGTIERSNTCITPSWWERWEAKIKDGDVWKCERCNARWLWVNSGSTKNWCKL